MRFSKTKAIVMSAVITLLCVGLIVAATFALFSASRTTNVHLSAGTLDAGLYLQSRTGVEIGDDGSFVEVSSPTAAVDLTKDDSAIFELDNMVPTMWQQAVLRVTNTGDVAFTYSVSIVNVDASEAAEGLLSRMQVTVTPSQGDAVTFTLADATAKGQDIALGTVVATDGAYGDFTVRVEFTAGSGIEDSAQYAGAQISFDLTVEAVQVTATAE